MNKGKYIVIEGIDGCGKSVLTSNLVTLLKRQASSTGILITKEPGGTELGKTLRAMVNQRKASLCDKAEFLLFAADRAQHIASVIVPALEQGTVVISDRSFISSIAYQGFGRGLDHAMITRVNEWVLGGLQPDVIVYLELDPAVAHARIEARNEVRTAFEKEQHNFWARVRAGFDACCAQYPQMVKIDATLPPEEVAQRAFNAVKKILF